MLVDTDEWSLYADASNIPAGDPSVPDGYYGSYGYQWGININGVNEFYQGGTTEEATADSSRQIKMENVDFFTFVPDVQFQGFIEGNYAAQVVRLKEIHDDAISVEVQASDSGLKGLMVRWFDPDTQDLAVENIFSATDTSAIQLPSLPEGGGRIYGVGAISESSLITLFDTEGDDTQDTVYDTDRWRLDLGDWPDGYDVWVEILLERRYEGSAGDIAPYDPWFVVVPEEWVPTPTPTTYARALCPDDDAADFIYPMQLLDYLFEQVVLKDVATDIATTDTTNGTEDGEDEEETEETTFDPCGSSEWESGIESGCGNDWDLDDVLDDDEPRPGTFLEQVWVQQCSLGVDISEYLDECNVDADTLDEDSEPSYNRQLNIGGRVDSSGEEAFWYGKLEGGSSYLIVIGGAGDEGSYELIVRQVEWSESAEEVSNCSY